MFTGEPQHFGLPYLGDHHWDPFWSAVAETGLSVSFHIGSGDFTSGFAPARLRAHGIGATRVSTSVALFLENGQQIVDLLMSGVLARFPTLRFVSVESGIGFLPFVLDAADYAFEDGKVWLDRPYFEMKPSEYFQRQVYGCWFFEERTVATVIDAIGSDRIMFETDYPHPICLFGNVRETIEAALAGQPDDVRRRVLWDNAAELYQVDDVEPATSQSPGLGVSTGELRWDGRVAVITGAGRNLGRAYALLLASRGASVVVNDLGVAISDTDGSGDAPAENPAAAVVAEIEAAGGKAAMSTDSVTTVEGGEAIIATALDAFGRVDVLINNAGVVRQAEFADYVPELLDPVIASQIGGHFNVTRPAWRAMRDAGYGRILNLSSGAGPLGCRGHGRILGGEDGDRRAHARARARRGAVRHRRECSGSVGEDPPWRLRTDSRVGRVCTTGSRSTSSRRSRRGSCTRTATRRARRFSVGGGYAGRVSVAVNDGHRWDRPMTPEGVRDAWSDVMADASWHPLPAGGGDVVRMLEGFNG